MLQLLHNPHCFFGCEFFFTRTISFLQIFITLAFYIKQQKYHVWHKQLTELQRHKYIAF